MLTRSTFSMPAVRWSSLGWRKIHGITSCNVVLCGGFLLFFPGNKYFNPHSKWWLDFCNCRKCLALGDFWCGVLVTAQGQSSRYTKVNARLSLARKLGIHCWNERMLLLQRSSWVYWCSACLNSSCLNSNTWREGCERPFLVLVRLILWLLCFPKPYPSPSDLFLPLICHLNLLHGMLVRWDWETNCLSKPAFNKVCLYTLQWNSSVGIKEGMAQTWVMAREEERS